MTETIRKAVLAAKAADDKKGEGIVVLDLKGICTFADAFVVVTGASNLQLKALTESVRMALKEAGHGNAVVDGDRQSSWIVMDYGDLLVHLMSPESRSYYRLEDLWGDGKMVEWQEAVGAG